MRGVPERLILLLVLLLGLIPISCRKAVSAPPVAAAPVVTPPPAPLAPTITLSADRTVINAGQTVTLSWQSSNATAVTLDNAIGNVAANGSRQVSPPASTSFTATAQGPGGTAASSAVRVTVNVIPPPVAQPQPPRTTPPAPRAPTLAEQFQAAMQNVLFDYDQYVIRNSETTKLRTMARWLIANPSVRFTIAGNADERGGQEYNIALGDERATAVRNYLASEGVPQGRMQTLTYGEERPICRDPNEDCWQRNRRAEFVMTL